MLGWAASLQVLDVSRGELTSEMNVMVFYVHVYALAQRDAMMQRCLSMLKKPTG